MRKYKIISYILSVLLIFSLLKIDSMAVDSTTLTANEYIRGYVISNEGAQSLNLSGISTPFFIKCSEGDYYTIGTSQEAVTNYLRNCGIFLDSGYLDIFTTGLIADLATNHYLSYSIVNENGDVVAYTFDDLSGCSYNPNPSGVIIGDTGTDYIYNYYITNISDYDTWDYFFVEPIKPSQYPENFNRGEQDETIAQYPDGVATISWRADGVDNDYYYRNSTWYCNYEEIHFNLLNYDDTKEIINGNVYDFEYLHGWDCTLNRSSNGIAIDYVKYFGNGPELVNGKVNSGGSSIFSLSYEPRNEYEYFASEHLITIYRNSEIMNNYLNGNGNVPSTIYNDSFNNYDNSIDNSTTLSIDKFQTISTNYTNVNTQVKDSYNTVINNNLTEYENNENYVITENPDGSKTVTNITDNTSTTYYYITNNYGIDEESLQLLIETIINNNFPDGGDDSGDDSGGGSGDDSGDDSGGGSGDDSGDDSSIWDRLANGIADLLSAIGEIIGGILAGLVEMITSLLNAFATIIESIGQFPQFLQAIFPFMPEELLNVFWLAIMACIVGGVIKFLRG